MTPYRLARRAEKLSVGFPAPHFPRELPAGTIAFDSGFASPRLLPDLSAVMQEALTARRDDTLQYSPTQGEPELRQWIARSMNEDGSRLAAENILITNGAKHGIELMCRLMLDTDDAVVVTAPTYFTAIPIFRNFGARFIEVGQDDHGMLVDDLAAKLGERRAAGAAAPKMIYNVADFHNPSGLTMPLSRRRRLVELAAEHGSLLIEDTPYRRVRFEGADIPTLHALDDRGIVVHVGTFSKLIAPGLRIGWIAAEASLIARLIQLKSDGGSSALLQRAIYDFCRSPAFPEHIARVRDTYRAHRDAAMASLAAEIPEAQVIAPEGGYYVWVRLPERIDGDELARRAAAAGVNIIPGSKFFAGDGGYPKNCNPARHHIRLSYSYESPDRIAEGVRRLADVYRTLAHADAVRAG